VGDDKAADSIEDTAVELSDLPNYIADFSAMMKKARSGCHLLCARRSRRNPLEAHFESKTKKGLYQFRGYRHRSGGFGQKNTEAR
jgi:hypothetical protein